MNYTNLPTLHRDSPKSSHVYSNARILIFWVAHFQAMRIFRYLTSESNQWHHNNQTTTTTTATGMIFSLSGTHCSWATNQLMSQLRIISLLTGEKHHPSQFANSRHKLQPSVTSNSYHQTKKIMKVKNPAHQFFVGLIFLCQILIIVTTIRLQVAYQQFWGEEMGVVPRLWDQAMPPTMGMSHLNSRNRQTSDIWKKNTGKKEKKLYKMLFFKKKWYFLYWNYWFFSFVFQKIHGFLVHFFIDPW